MSKVQKYLSIIFCACLISLSAFVSLSLICHTDYKCTGEHCNICLHMVLIGDALKHVTPAAVFVLAVMAVMVLKEGILCKQKPYGLTTLILLKTQLSN